MNNNMDKAAALFVCPLTFWFSRHQQQQHTAENGWKRHNKNNMNCGTDLWLKLKLKVHQRPSEQRQKKKNRNHTPSVRPPRPHTHTRAWLGWLGRCPHTVRSLLLAPTSQVAIATACRLVLMLEKCVCACVRVVPLSWLGLNTFHLPTKRTFTPLLDVQDGKVWDC